jgi:hypothetical protein
MNENLNISKPTLYLLIFGLLINFGLALHQYLLFLKAYFSSQKAVVLYINYFGEADGELIMLTFSIIVGFFATAYILWAIRNGRTIVSRKE